MTASTLRAAAASGDELAARQRQYAALDAAIEPAEFRAPDLTQPADAEGRPPGRDRPRPLARPPLSAATRWLRRRAAPSRNHLWARAGRTGGHGGTSHCRRDRGRRTRGRACWPRATRSGTTPTGRTRPRPPTRSGRRSASGEFTGVEFTDETAGRRDHAVRRSSSRGWARSRPTVEVGEVSESGSPASAATAELAWTWPLGEQEWSYAAEAAVRKVDDDWQVVWSPALVEPSLTEEEVLDATPIAPERRGAHRCARAGAGRRPAGRPVRHRPLAGRRRPGRGSPPGSSPSSPASTSRRTSSRSRPPATRRSSRRSSTATRRCRRRSRAASTTSRARSPWPTSCRSRRPGSSPRRSSAPSARSPPR